MKNHILFVEVTPVMQRDRLVEHFSHYPDVKTGKQGNLPNPYFWFTLHRKGGWIKVHYRHVETFYNGQYYDSWKEFKEKILIVLPFVHAGNAVKQNRTAEFIQQTLFPDYAVATDKS